MGGHASACVRVGVKYSDVERDLVLLWEETLDKPMWPGAWLYNDSQAAWGHALEASPPSITEEVGAFRPLARLLQMSDVSFSMSLGNE